MDIIQETPTKKKSLNQVNEKEEEYHDDPANKAKSSPIKVEMVNTASESQIKQ
jgi:hypothetical protein